MPKGNFKCLPLLAQGKNAGLAAAVGAALCQTGRAGRAGAPEGVAAVPKAEAAFDADTASAQGLFCGAAQGRPVVVKFFLTARWGNLWWIHCLARNRSPH